jgi:hypothetical protein
VVTRTSEAVISGGNNDDTYVFGLGYGNDTSNYSNILSGGNQTVLFGAGVDPSQVQVVCNASPDITDIASSDFHAIIYENSDPRCHRHRAHLPGKIGSSRGREELEGEMSKSEIYVKRCAKRDHHGGSARRNIDSSASITHQMAMFVLSLTTSLFFFIPICSAGTFALATGEQYALCRLYQKNLDTLPRATMQTHEWPVDPKLKDFSKPLWKRIDARKHLDIIKKLDTWAADPLKQLDEAAADAKWREGEREVIDLIDKNMVHLETARFDFDSDGHLDQVYRYYHPIHFLDSAPDDPDRIYGYWYIYFNDEDPRISEDFRRNFPQVFDSFFFRKRFYLVGWFVGELNVFEPSALRIDGGLLVRPVCRFSFER